MSATLELARQLIAQPSVTPADENCQVILAERLKALGFRIESMPFGEVSNLWAEWGDSGPLFVFAGHTDVVPSGPEEEWTSHPFEANIIDGELIGRGAADMKGSVAVFIQSIKNFLSHNPKPNFQIWVMMNSRRL